MIELYCPTCNLVVEKFEEIRHQTYKGGDPYPVHMKCGFIVQKRTKDFDRTHIKKMLKELDNPKPFHPLPKPDEPEIPDDEEETETLEKFF